MMDIFKLMLNFKKNLAIFFVCTMDELNFIKI